MPEAPLHKGRSTLITKIKTKSRTASTMLAGMQHLPRSLSHGSGLTLVCRSGLLGLLGPHHLGVEKHCVPNVSS